MKKIKNWQNNNQEKGSERYQEREELKKELEEYSKDIRMIIESPAYKINDLPLQKAILIQNLHTQRKLTQATNGLKAATWILALATSALVIGTAYGREQLNSTIQIILNAFVVVFIIGMVIYIIKEITKSLIIFSNW